MKKGCILSILVVLSSLLYAQTILHDNGPLITNTGSGGVFWSVIQSPNSAYGTNNSKTVFYRVADDFSVTAESWAIDSIVFYEYQTDALTATSSFTAFNVRIWNGIPGNISSTVVWGDTTTNILTNSYWSKIYRATIINGATNRPIMKNVCTTPSLTLTKGENYWIDWQAKGSLISGPWQPYITIVGQAATGNAKQYANKTWLNSMDGTNAQGFPFTIYGTTIPLGVEEIATDQKFNIYPNPVNKELNISSVAPMKKVIIINAIGQEILNENVRGNHYIVNTSSYNKGFYFIQVGSENGKATSKFVVNE